jgi:transposase
LVERGSTDPIDRDLMASMRGTDTKQSSMFCLLSPESRVPQGHPLRPIKSMCEAVLKELSSTFDAMYSLDGRDSVPPERLLKATVLMALYTIRSERQFCEQLDYNMLFRWFLDMDMVEVRFHHTTFSKNRQRLIGHDVAKLFFALVVQQARTAGLMSREHFTVDGTLIEAWASFKSLRRKDGKSDDGPPDDPGNPTVNFRGEKLANDTHESKTDPEAKIARKGKGKEAKLAFAAHALMENRNGLLVDVRITDAARTTERDAALVMLDETLPGTERLTLGGDKGYDTKDFVRGCRERNVSPHVAQNITKYRGSAIDARTTRPPGYEISQRIRKRVEEIFGWCKTVGNFRKTRYKGQARNQMAAYFVGAAYNLLRIARLAEVPA